MGWWRARLHEWLCVDKSEVPSVLKIGQLASKQEKLRPGQIRVRAQPALHSTRRRLSHLNCTRRTRAASSASTVTCKKIRSYLWLDIYHLAQRTASIDACSKWHAQAAQQCITWLKPRALFADFSADNPSPGRHSQFRAELYSIMERIGPVPRP